MVLTVIILSSVTGFASVANVYFEKIIIDRLVTAYTLGDYDRAIFFSIVAVVFLALIVSLGISILNSLSDFLTRMLSRFFDLELDRLMAKQMTSLDIVTLEDPDFKDRFDKIQRESGRRAWQLIPLLSELPQYVVGFITSVGIISIIHPLLGLGVVLISLPRMLVNKKYVKKRYQLDSDIATDNRMWGWLSSYLLRSSNYMELKVLGIADYMINRMTSIGNSMFERRMKLHKNNEVERIWTLFPTTFFELVVSALLIYWVLIRRITVGTFQLYLRSVRAAQNNFISLVRVLIELYENYIYVTDLIWFLNLKPTIADDENSKGVPTSFNIKFDEVWFKYREGNAWSIKGVSFDIKRGEKIALVGENGAGKTTLIKLLARFYDVSRGSIMINDTNLKEINHKIWKEKFAILFQQFEQYPFTAQESIGYGDITRLSDLSSIRTAARKVGIDDYIESLPLKYENPLTPEFEKGIHPSVGQWQRIGIARMLFRQSAEVLILDEPTSNVDPEAEEKIFKELSKITKDKILIFVTQRFSSVRIADRIFVMDKGRIIETGTHDELMKLGGKYHRLFTLQANAYHK